MSQSAAKPLQDSYGIIYLATSPTGKKYVGQHKTENFAERKRSHYYNFITYLKEKCILELNRKFHPNRTYPSNPKGFCTALYNAMCKYSFHAFKWQVLRIKVPLSEIDEIEDKLIIEHNTLQPNGYNLKLNARDNGKSAYSEETRKRMSESSKKKVRDNLHNYRRNHKELEGLPQHIIYYKSKGTYGYKVCNHPKYPGKSKTFTSKTAPVSELKKRVIKFLKEIGANLNPPPVPDETEKKVSRSVVMQNREIPRGITINSLGHIQVDFQKNGQRFTKYFSQPKDEALKLAKEWMQNKKNELESDNLSNSDESECEAINEEDYPNGEVDSGFDSDESERSDNLDY